MTRKLRKFLALPAWRRRLLLEALVYLGWARVLKALPFALIAPRLGRRMAETPLDHRPSDVKPIRHVAQAVQATSRHTLWESQCLVRAIAAQKMLARRGVASTLYLGTARDEQGRMIAHAWLRSGPYYVTGAEEMGRFTAVASFGTDHRTERVEGT